MTRLAHWDDAPRVRREVGEISDLDDRPRRCGPGRSRCSACADGSPTLAATPPPHAHGAEEEIFYVLAGGEAYGRTATSARSGPASCIVHLADEEAHALKAGAQRACCRSACATSRPVPAPHSGRAWAGATIVAADGPGDMFAFDAEAGPLPWAAPGPRLPNVVNAADVAERQSGVAGWPGDLWQPRPAAVRTGLNIGHCMPGMLRSSAALSYPRGALRHPRRLGHLAWETRSTGSARARRLPAGRHRRGARAAGCQTGWARSWPTGRGTPTT